MFSQIRPIIFSQQKILLIKVFVSVNVHKDVFLTKTQALGLNEPKSFHVCKLLNIFMVTWPNRLMFYIRYIPHNMTLLLNKAANLCLYDQTDATIGCLQYNLLSYVRNTKRFRAICAARWAMETTTCCGPGGLSSPRRCFQVLLLSGRSAVHHRQWQPPMPTITPSCHFKLFLGTLCWAKVTAMETHFP